jgi:DNA-binding MarR family transcriptional regulator
LTTGSNDDERRSIKRQLHVLERFRMVRHTMPVHLVSALFRVYLDEGKSLIHYAREGGVSQSVMSRHMIELGSEPYRGKPMLGLIEKRTSPTSLREYEIYLTPKGRKAVQEAAQILSSGRVDE